ncbi:hypothetical protein CTAYLR_008715 [Chrysophaeum taylorii]|uniref:Uncharacterized protein n=1 Tax=Chrysophaeum taylorii TaxID=2483200 RepID=A0AAD7UJ19_9STRA|nr:hypothetical protein CTAYLR_008715 [Chrysophaeum taylorii]
MKVRGLRVLMAAHGVEAFLVPSGDAHASEYVAARAFWRGSRRACRGGARPWKLIRIGHGRLLPEKDRCDRSLFNLRGSDMECDPVFCSYSGERDPLPVRARYFGRAWTLRASARRASSSTRSRGPPRGETASTIGMDTYLDVHEGPAGIGGGALAASTLSLAARLPYLEDTNPGHYFSNEPGF